MPIDYLVPRVAPENITGDRCDGEGFRCSSLYCEPGTCTYYCSRYKKTLRLDTSVRLMPAVRIRDCLFDKIPSKLNQGGK